MKKVLYGLFIFVISIMFINVDAKTIYLQECEYTDEYKQWLKLSDEEKKDVIVPTMCKNDNVNKFTTVGNGTYGLSGISANDSKFNLKDYDLVTNVKNQEHTGSCWAFATNASIESNLLVNGMGTYDLSEAHMELATQNTVPYNRLTFNRTVNTGGNFLMSSAYLRNNWGSVLETTLPFNALSQMINSNGNVNEDKAVSEDRILNNKAMLDVDSITMFGNSGVCTGDTIKEIKEYLITNGALATTMHIGNVGSFEAYQYYDGKAYDNVPANYPANHAITIVGWDDTISKDKFKTENKPTKDGAFIVKNSYGEASVYSLTVLKQELWSIYESELKSEGINSVDQISNRLVTDILGLTEDMYKIEGDNLIIYSGDNGYYYISYEDVRVCNNVVGFFDVNTEVEQYVYGYDDLGLVAQLTAKYKEIYLANIFTKQSAGNESLKEINTYFNNAGTNYEVYFANGENKDINSAKLIASGTSKFIGYNTIKVEDTVISSSKYTIIIKLFDDDSFQIPVMANLHESFSTAQYAKGVQYISVDSVTYADVYNEFINQPFHLLIKAYTDPYQGESNEEDVPSSDDNTNDDGKIEITPSDMDNKIDNDESNEENPNTGDMVTYTLMISLAIIGVGFISYRKTKQNN